MDNPVGDGPEYEHIRVAARNLLPLFVPMGLSGKGNWGCGLIEMLRPVDGGHEAAIVYPVVSSWEKDSNAIRRVVDLGMIRATGIALLAYAEAHDG